MKPPTFLHRCVSVGTASQLTDRSRYATQDPMCHQRALLEERNLMVVVTVVVENSSPPTQEEPHWFISVRGDGSIQATLQDMYHDKCRCP